MSNKRLPASNQGVMQVVMRNQFYRDGYMAVRLAVMFMLVLNLSLIGLVYFRFTHPPIPQYFATTPDGRIINEHPLSDPTLSDEAVVQWTANAVHKAFTLDFVHWREQLQSASANFTPDGWTYFSDTLKQSDNLKTLVDLKMVADATVTGAPEVVQKGLVQGHFAWNIRLPMLITYSNGQKTISQPVKVTVIVVREPVQNYPEKIAINNVFVDAVNPGGMNNGL
jgi:intracellular multiplication protein IcmL